jgi:uncharacterized repeat protein (TIGR01451 family)
VFNNSGTFDIQNNGAIGGGIGGADNFNNSGTLTKSGGGGTSNINSVFNNTGTVNANTASLNFTNSFTQTMGSTTLNGGNIGGGITFNFAGGTLMGGAPDTFTGTINNTGAMVAPGLSPGILNVTGAFMQSGTGALNVEVNGLTAGTQFDQMNMTAAATLGGTLNVTLGFVPNAGDTFIIMTFSSRGGTTFTTENLPNPGGGNVMTVVYGATSVQLLVAPPASADLSVTKADSPDPAFVGQPLTYTLTVMNGGPNDATGVTVTDTLPANVMFNSASAGCVNAAGTVTCNVGNLANGASTMLTITVTPLAAAGGTTITNMVTVTGNEADSNAGNNSDSEDTVVNASADVSVTKTDMPDPINFGSGDITYTVTVANAGPSDATNVVLTDTLPAGVNFVSASAGCANAAGTVTCNLGTLASGTNTMIMIVVTPTAAGMLTDTATVTAAESDPVPANNTAMETTTVVAQADLSVTKTDSPDPIILGTGDITYTVTVANAGPNDATSVVLTDTLPAGVTFVSATAPCTQAAGTVTCNLGTIANGANTVITIVITPTAPGVLTNTASVTATENDPVAANNMATEMTTVNAMADISVTKTDAPDPIVLGSGNLTYTVTVANAGPSPAAGVVLTDTLPAGVTFVSATAPCTQAAGTVTCNLGTIASGANTVITIVVTPTAVGILTNTATVTTTTADANAANNMAVEMTTVNASANLSITKTDAPDPAIVNQNLTYTITVNNAGPSPATMLTMTDVLPANTTFQSLASPAGWTCMTPAVGANGTVTCTNPNLASGAAAATFTLVVRPTAAGNLSNTATIASATADPNNANNSATATTTVNLVAPATDFSLTATPLVNSVMPGQSGTYTVTVGPLPVGSNFASAIMLACSSPTGSCTISPNSLTPGMNPANATMTVSTQELAASAVAPPGQSFLPTVPVTLYIIGPWAMGLLLIFTGWFGRRYRRPRLALCHTLGLLVLIASFFITQSACTNDKQVVIGPYAVTVTGTSGTITHTTVVVLNVIK